jgi:PhoPQ-activated pathogenicity-related protein
VHVLPSGGGESRDDNPWAYRDRLVLPKVMINGTNDFYWTLDALNVYWRDIPGDNWVIYVPNAGHDLRRQDKPQGEQLNHLVNGLAAFVRYQGSGGRAMPDLKWRHDSVNGRVRLTVDATPAPLAARLWVARSPTRDFRRAKWTTQAVTLSGGKIIGEVTRPEKGYTAFYGELDYSIDGLNYQLSTQLRIADCQGDVC